jgi:membrane-associated phospholipid phosphatase
MTAVLAVAAVLWMSYPRYRAVYGLACGVMAAALVGLNFHFVGDVIAGGFLGATVGLLVLLSFPGLRAATTDHAVKKPIGKAPESTKMPAVNGPP